MVYGPQRLWLTVGSANFTRRSLGDYDLEANLAVEMTRDAPLAQQAVRRTSTPCGATARRSASSTPPTSPPSPIPRRLNYWLGRLLEGAGLSAF